MKHITDHYDGHGLNESIAITADEPSNGGASHKYEAWIGNTRGLAVQFQQGARNEPNSIPGVTEGVLLAVLIDRLRGFQAGPFACRENAIILTKLEECLMWTKERAHARARRGVLGKEQK